MMQIKQRKTNWQRSASGGEQRAASFKLHLQAVDYVVIEYKTETASCYNDY